MAVDVAMGSDARGPGQGPSEHKDAKDAKGKAKGKGKRKAPPTTMSTRDITGMIHDMAKLLVTHDEEISHMESLALCTWILPKEYAPAISAQEEGQAYHKKLEEARAAHADAGAAARKAALVRRPTMPPPPPLTLPRPAKPRRPSEGS